MDAPKWHFLSAYCLRRPPLKSPPPNNGAHGWPATTRPTIKRNLIEDGRSNVCKTHFIKSQTILLDTYIALLQCKDFLFHHCYGWCSCFCWTVVIIMRKHCEILLAELLRNKIFIIPNKFLKHSFFPVWIIDPLFRPACICLTRFHLFSPIVQNEINHLCRQRQWK